MIAQTATECDDDDAIDPDDLTDLSGVDALKIVAQASDYLPVNLFEFFPNLKRLSVINSTLKELQNIFANVR